LPPSHPRQTFPTHLNKPLTVGPEKSVTPQGRSRCGFAHLAWILEREHQTERRGSGGVTSPVTPLWVARGLLFLLTRTPVTR
jgi:hypothetical protein